MLELLHLSGQISLLVLLASALAAGIGWWVRGLRSLVHAPAEQTPAPATTPSPDAGKLQALEQRLAESEQQCSTALEQRDNAEQEARSQSQLVHSLEATQQRLNAEAAELRQTLTAAEQRHTQLLNEQKDSAESQTSTLQELRSRVMTAEAAAATARADYQEVADQVARAKADAEMLKSRFTTAEKSQQTAEEKSKQLGRELEKQRLSSAQQEQKLTAELQALRDQLKASSQTTAELQTALEQANEALAKATAAAATAATTAEGTKPKRKPPTKRTVTVPAGESPVAAIQAADAAAQQSLLDLQSEYEQRLSSVNELDAAAPVDKPALAAARTLLRDTQKRLATARTDVERTARQRTALERTFAQLPDSQPDDLTLLKGVKSILAGKLNALGIFTYQQILDWPAEDRVAYGELLGFGNRIDRDDWVGQARKLQSEKQG